MGALKTFGFGIVLGGGCLVQVSACGHLGLEELPSAEDGGPSPGSSSGGSNGSSGSTSTSTGGTSSGSTSGSPRDGSIEPEDGGGVTPTDGGPVPVDAGVCRAGLPCDVVYVSPSGDDGASGGPDDPVRTITKGIKRAAERGWTEVHVQDGQYVEVPELTNGINVTGGYSCTAGVLPCDWKYAPPGNTVLTVRTGPLVIGPEIGRETTLRALHILAPTNAASSTFGVTAVVIQGGSPILREVEIVTGNVPGNRTTALAISGAAPTVGPLLENCRIEAGSALDESIGVAIDNRGAPTGSAAPGLKITGGSITSGQAATSVAVYAAASTSNGALIERVNINSGPAKAKSATEAGQSWAVVATGGLRLQMNRINTAAFASGAPKYCTAPADSSDWCGGVKTLGATVTMHSNWIGGVRAPRSTAVLLSDSEGVPGAVILNGNTLDGGGDREGGPSSLSAAVALQALRNTSIVVGSVRNNILGSGYAANRFNIHEEVVGGVRVANVSVLDHNCFHHPGGVGANDYAYRYVELGVPKTYKFDQLALAKSTTGNTTDDPMFTALNPPQLLIQAQSKLVNAGTTEGGAGELASKDIQGNPRPFGSRDGGAPQMDIGAHEVQVP